MLKKIGLLVVTTVSVYAMHSLEININEKDLEFGLNVDMGQYNRGVEPDTTFVGVKYLKASDDNSANEDGEIVDLKYFLELNFLIKQEINSTGLKVGLGIKTNFSKVNDYTFMSIPIGLDVSYELPLKNFIPVEVGAELYYAPESLCSSDAISFLEYRVGANFEVIERGSIFVGYRNVDTNYEASAIKENITYNKSGYFGFKFEF